MLAFFSFGHIEFRMVNTSNDSGTTLCADHDHSRFTSDSSMVIQYIKSVIEGPVEGTTLEVDVKSLD